jgi:transcriptional regulator with XRE-family HTH domain
LSGLHRAYISGVERGVRNPTVVVLQRIARPLKAPCQDCWTIPQTGGEPNTAGSVVDRASVSRHPNNLRRKSNFNCIPLGKKHSRFSYLEAEMTALPFNGSIEFQLGFAAFGRRVVRKARLDYAYEPDWPYLDAPSGKERRGAFQFKLKLSVLALPRARSNAGRQTVTRYWASADQLLSGGVLGERLLDQFRSLVDAQACETDRKNRLRAGWPLPPLPEQI